MVYKCAVIASWTIVQTLIHLFCIYVGFGLYDCSIDPSQSYVLTFIYLTYFYRNVCGDIYVEEINNRSRFRIPGADTWHERYSREMYVVLKDIEERALLPEESIHVGRTHIYFITYIVCDALWITFSLALVVGLCLKVKRGCSLFFYCPFIVINAVIVLMDVISAAHFGLDLYRLNSYTAWLHFIGVRNYGEFENLNSYETSKLVPLGPPIAIVLLFTRLFIIWVLNVVCLYQVISAAILSFQGKLGKKNGKYSHHRSTFAKNNDLDSSAERIRQWQMFYGSLESNSNAGFETNAMRSRKSSLSNSVPTPVPDRCVSTTF